MKWIDGMIPTEGYDPVEIQNLLRKGRLILIISIAAAFLCFLTPTVILLSANEIEIEDFGNLVFGCIFLSNIYLLRKTKSIRITGTVFFLECAIIVVSFSFFLGGIHPTTIIFLLCWPFANLYFLSPKIWRWMMGILVVVSILFFVFDDWVHSIEILGGHLNRPVVFMSVLAAFLFNILIGWAYEDYQKQSIKQITELLKDLHEAKQKAEAANHAKSVFLATMSHELRTPLTAIIGHTEMIAEEVSDVGLSDSILTDVENIRMSGNSLLNQINSILDLSKVEAGREDVRIEPIEINELIVDAIHQTHLQTEKSNNQIIVKPDENGNSMALGDRQKLLQVLLNLIGNANKFTSNGKIVISVKEEGNWVQIAVRDTGIGLPESDINRLFEPFVQSDDAYNRVYEGSGLGLAICKKFCEIMGGKISAENHPQGGAVFRIKLPAG